jgi:tRNA (guanine-N7-)-methyltransferase
MAKPEDLKAPFDWRKPAVMIDGRVLYVPEFRVADYESFVFPGWSSEQIFGNENPIHMEYCSGNGAWIAAKAAANPSINWVAVEKRFDRARKIWSKANNLQLKNLFIICGEALGVTRRYLPAQSVSHLFINFPDPWPKRRHARHRLIQPAFLDEVTRISTPETRLTLVTDDAVYSAMAIKEIHRHGKFQSIYPEPYFVHEQPDYGTSYFEELWREKGRVIYYHSFGR